MSVFSLISTPLGVKRHSGSRFPVPGSRLEKPTTHPNRPQESLPGTGNGEPGTGDRASALRHADLQRGGAADGLPRAHAPAKRLDYRDGPFPLPLGERPKDSLLAFDQGPGDG